MVDPGQSRLADANAVVGCGVGLRPGYVSRGADIMLAATTAAGTRDAGVADALGQR
jgi:hypothetical protein